MRRPVVIPMFFLLAVGTSLLVAWWFGLSGEETGGRGDVAADSLAGTTSEPERSSTPEVVPERAECVPVVVEVTTGFSPRRRGGSAARASGVLGVEVRLLVTPSCDAEVLVEGRTGTEGRCTLFVEKSDLARLTIEQPAREEILTDTGTDASAQHRGRRWLVFATAWSPGFASEGYVTVRLSESDASRVELRLDAGTLVHGRVVSADGTPVFAELRLAPSEREVRTRQDGEFRIVVPGAEPPRLMARSRDVLRAPGDRMPRVPGAVHRALDADWRSSRDSLLLELEGEGRLAGTLLDQEGRPYVRKELVAVSTEAMTRTSSMREDRARWRPWAAEVAELESSGLHHARGLTDSQGAFEICGLAEGEFVLGTLHLGRWFDWTVAAGADRLELRIERCMILVDLEDPAAQVELIHVWQCPLGTRPQHLREPLLSASAGSSSISVPSGHSYRIACYAAGCPVSPEHGGSGWVDVPPGSPGATIRLEAPAAWWWGRVAVSLPAESPLESATVVATSPSGLPTRARLRVSPGEERDADLPAGRYRLVRALRSPIESVLLVRRSSASGKTDPDLLAQWNRVLGEAGPRPPSLGGFEHIEETAFEVSRRGNTRVTLRTSRGGRVVLLQRAPSVAGARPPDDEALDDFTLLVQTPSGWSFEPSLERWLPAAGHEPRRVRIVREVLEPGEHRLLDTDAEGREWSRPFVVEAGRLTFVDLE